MSYSSGFSLCIFDRHDPEAEKMLPGLAALLPDVPEPAEKESDDLEALRQHFIGLTRSDWFKSASKRLFDAAGGLDILRFMSEETYTHRQFLPYYEDRPLELTSGGEDLQYTAIDPKRYLEIAEAIDWLFAWCRNHAPEVEKLIGDAEENVLDGLYRVILSDEDKDLDAEEGWGAQFLFCVLKVARRMLLHAHRHGLYAVYKNVQYATFGRWQEQTQCKDGSLHANPAYRIPLFQSRPLEPPPPAGLPIDLPALLSACGEDERQAAKMIRFC